MIDEAWFEHLANAQFSSGHWQVQDPQAVEAKASRKVMLALDELFMLTQEAVTIFNHHARHERSIKLLRVSSDSASEGFMLLQGSNQVHVKFIDRALQVSLTMQVKFQSKSMLMYQFLPTYDVFGEVRWNSSTLNKIHMEQIPKVILQDLCRVFDQGANIQLSK